MLTNRPWQILLYYAMLQFLKGSSIMPHLNPIMLPTIRLLISGNYHKNVLIAADLAQVM